MEIRLNDKFEAKIRGDLSGSLNAKEYDGLVA